MKSYIILAIDTSIILDVEMIAGLFYRTLDLHEAAQVIANNYQTIQNLGKHGNVTVWIVPASHDF